MHESRVLGGHPPGQIEFVAVAVGVLDRGGGLPTPPIPVTACTTARPGVLSAVSKIASRSSRPVNSGTRQHVGQPPASGPASRRTGHLTQLGNDD
jgi:hypothetical protein